MKRYAPESGESGMEIDSLDGGWVSYYEADKEITRLRALLDDAEKALEPFSAHYSDWQTRYVRRGGSFAGFRNDKLIGDIASGAFTHGDFRSVNASLDAIEQYNEEIEK